MRRRVQSTNYMHRQRRMWAAVPAEPPRPQPPALTEALEALQRLATRRQFGLHEDAPRGPWPE